MANDLVVQLLLKTGTFSNDLKTAKGQVQNFQQGCKKAGDGLNSFGKGLGLNIGSLAKFGSAVGVAAAAGKGLKEIMESNQTTGDFFANTMAAAKTSVENLAGAIGTLDFTSFYNGLDSVWRKAHDLAETLDQLGDTTMSFGIMSGELDLDVKRQQLIINDPKSTPEQIQAAKDRLDEISKELAGYTKVAAEDAMKAVRQTIIQKSILEESDLAENFIADIFSIDLVEARDEIKKSVEDAYKEYKKAARDIRNKYSKFDRDHPNTDMGARYRREMAELIQQYSQDIAAYTVQVKMSDKQRENLANLIAQKQAFEGKSLDEQLKALKAMNKAQKELNATTKTTTTTKSKRNLNEELDLNRDIVEQLQEQIAKETELIKKYDEGTAGWLKQIEKVAELNKKLDETINKVEAIKLRQKMAELGPLPKLNIDLPNRVDYTPEMKLATPYQAPKAPIDFSKALGNAQKVTSGFQNTAMAVNMLSDSMKKLREDEEENVTGWEKFVDVLSFTINILNTISTVMETINMLNELSGAIALKSAAEKSAAAGIEVAAAGTEVAANTAVAATGAAASQAGIPIVGPALAIAAVAAILAAIAAATKSVGKFATGGIVGGQSFGGDRLTANVNSGEMILNRTQQANLFRQINNGGAGGQVQFHISGTDLIGVLNNNNRKQSLIR